MSAVASHVAAQNRILMRKLVVDAEGAPPIWVAGPDSADEVGAWALREKNIEQAVGRVAWVDARWRDRLYAGPEMTSAEPRVRSPSPVIQSRGTRT